jgi:exopolysaccharide production protein ExoZ
VVFALVHDDGTTHALAYVAGSPLVFEFVFGMLVAAVFQPRAQELRAVSAWWGPLLIGLAVTMLALSSQMPHAMDRRVIAWGVPATLLVAGMIVLDGGWLRRSKLLLLLGDASYSIYLSHQFPMMLMARQLKKGWFATVSPDVVSLAGIAVAIAIGVAGYFAVEQPLCAFLTRKPALPPGAPTQS